MDQKQKDEEKTFLYELIDNLNLQIQFFLFSIGIFNEADLDHIQSEITQQEQRLKLLNILQNRKYEETDLINGLEHCKQIHLLDQLQLVLLALKQNQILHRKIAWELRDPHLEFDGVKISKLWEMPQRNRYFTGRDTLLEQVRACFASKVQIQYEQRSKEKLSQSYVTVISACQGIGGVGKTQLAIEFVHRFQDVYPYVFWIPAESSSQIEIAYRKLAHDLQMDTEKQAIDAIVREIKAWFERHPGCLMVYDNAPDSETIKDYLPINGCHIIVTSRNTEWHWLWQSTSITVDVFNIIEAREFFQKFLGHQLDMDEVDALATLLGYLPLALAQAAAYIKNSKLTIAQYIELYQLQKEKLLADKSLPKYHHEPVFVTWDITMEVIQKKSLLAVHLLKVCAFLHSADIPDFFLQAVADTPDTLDNPDSEICEYARGILDSYSMITVNSEKNTVSIHRILQDIIQLQLTKQNCYSLLVKVGNLLDKTFPKDEKIEDYTKITNLIPHLEIVLRHVDQNSFEERLNDDITAEVILLLLGIAYHIIGDYRKAREVCERALSISEQHYGSNHQYYAATLNILGAAYLNLGDYAKAREYLERALPIYERHYGSNHPHYTATLNNLSETYRNLGDFAKARDVCERALPIFEHASNRLKFAVALNSLGNAHINLGDYGTARDYLQRALSIVEQHYGPNHPHFALTLNNLGETFRNSGNYARAREYFERALPIFEQRYGSNHPKVAIILNNIGESYENLGNYTKQSECLERALPLFEQHYGSNHPQSVLPLNNLGLACINLGDYTKACKHLERALSICEQHYGPNHLNLAITLNNLGETCRNLGDYARAREYFERALPIFDQHYGSNHPQFAGTINNLGLMYLNLANYATAREYFERALPIFEQHYDSNHSQFACIINNLGSAYSKLGDYSRAREYHERALPIFEQHYGLNHPKVVIILNNLAESYENLGNYTKQGEYLERALSICEQNYGSNHEDVGMLLRTLGTTYKDLGDYQKSCRYLERALPIFEQHYGSNHENTGLLLYELGMVCGFSGDYSKQLEYYARSLPVIKHHYGPNNLMVTMASGMLSKINKNPVNHSAQYAYIEPTLD